MFQLSAEQQAIIDAVKSTKDSIIVSANPGSGKTTLLKLLLPHLGTLPSATKALAFQKKNADSLKAAFPPAWKDTASTIHSLGYFVLNNAYTGKFTVKTGKYRDIAYDFGYLPKWNKGRSPKISNKDLIQRDALSAASSRDLFSALSQLRSNMVDCSDLEEIQGRLPEVVEQYGLNGILKPHLVAVAIHDLFMEGQQRFFSKHILDFDDMLCYPVEQELLSRVQFDALLVDEAQDLSPIKQEFLFQMEVKRYIIVGDPKQAIFGFAGATNESMAFMSVRLELKGYNPTEFPLSTSYRMGKTITSFVNKVFPAFNPIIPGNPHDGAVAAIQPKEMFEATVPGDVVISRTNAALVLCCLKLLSRGKKALISGNNNVDARIRATFSEAIDLWQPAAMRLLSQLDKKQAQDAFVVFNTEEVFAAALDLWEEKELARLESEVSKEICSDTVACCHLFLGAVKQTYDSTGDVDKTPNKRLSDLAKVLDAKVKETFATGKENLDQCIVLMTIHKSKGQEANRVFVYEAGNLPMYRKSMNAAERQEERQVAYVAITRAKSDLFLVGRPYWMDEPMQDKPEPESVVDSFSSLIKEDA